MSGVCVVRRQAQKIVINPSWWMCSASHKCDPYAAVVSKRACDYTAINIFSLPWFNFNSSRLNHAQNVSSPRNCQRQSKINNPFLTFCPGRRFEGKTRSIANCKKNKADRSERNKSGVNAPGIILDTRSWNGRIKELRIARRIVREHTVNRL